MTALTSRYCEELHALLEEAVAELHRRRVDKALSGALRRLLLPPSFSGGCDKQGAKVGFHRIGNPQEGVNR